MESFSQLPEYQKAEFMRYLEEQQMKESLRYAVLLCCTYWL